MSSATTVQPDAYQRMEPGLVDGAMRKIGVLGMSPRQQQLNRLWAYYCTQQYDARKVDWDGTPHMGHQEHEVVATAGFIPPVFVDQSGAALPLKFRRPTAPYHLARVVVKRFTSLLFSERQHPTIDVPGDADTEDYIDGLVDAGRLWAAMVQARNFGGAMGSVAIGFKFANGHLRIEVHDPRWLHPVFVSREDLKLASLEKRYMYPVEERDAKGVWQNVWYWYRRVIDRFTDTIYAQVPVGDGEEPDWERAIEERVEHQLGFCPVVWIQNQVVSDDIDGEPDCLGVYEMSEEIDALLAQSTKGTKANCDPTVVIVTPDSFDDVLKKGSENAIKLTAGSAAYMEINGSGLKSARELASELRGLALEVVQCVTDHPDVANRTATEIERVYSSMLARADEFREQYGERGVKPLVEMILEAVRRLSEPREVDGQIVRAAIEVPPSIKDGQLQSRKLGTGKMIQLRWPRYFAPSLADAQQAVQAAVAAKAGGVVDQVTASKLVAEAFGVTDVTAMIEVLRKEQAQEEQALTSQLLSESALSSKPEAQA